MQTAHKYFIFQNLPDAPYLLESMIDNLEDIQRPLIVSNLLTATTKLFFSRPAECQDMLGKLLEFCVGECSKQQVTLRSDIFKTFSFSFLCFIGERWYLVFQTVNTLSWFMECDIVNSLVCFVSKVIFFFFFLSNSQTESQDDLHLRDKGQIYYRLLSEDVNMVRI